MDINIYFKGIVDSDPMPVVICDTGHKVVYCNPAAVKRYGRDLTGSSILGCHGEKSGEIIRETLEWFSESHDNNVRFETHNPDINTDFYTYAIRNDDGELIGCYEKHECRSAEKK